MVAATATHPQKHYLSYASRISNRELAIIRQREMLTNSVSSQQRSPSSWSTVIIDRRDLSAVVVVRVKSRRRIAVTPEHRRRRKRRTFLHHLVSDKKNRGMSRHISCPQLKNSNYRHKVIERKPRVLTTHTRAQGSPTTRS